MAYPGPPGVSSKSSHPSLPPRPPPSKSVPGFKPAFSAAPSQSASPAPAPSYAATPGAPPGYAASPATYSSAPRYGPQYGGTSAPPGASHTYSQPPVAAVGSGRGGYGVQQMTPSSYGPGQNYGQTSYYGAASGAASTSSYAAAPQIRNPFPTPAGQAANSDYDPETAAQIAQWQSAYMPREHVDAANGVRDGNTGRVGPRQGAGFAQGGANPMVATTDAGAYPSAGDAAATAAAAAAAADAATGGLGGADQKKKTVFREGGGKKWADDSLMEWDPSHLRLFVGNLAGETTNESLLKAFARWASVQHAKVVRDKRTSKSKGYGFVSFSDPDDFFQAAKEMNGKYIQSHPVIVRKSTTEIKPQTAKDDRRHGKGGGKAHQKGGGNRNGSGAEAQGSGGFGSGQAYEPHLGPTAAGVTKPGQKTKGGLKLLG